MNDRKYFPTFGDLVDRLSIVLLKSIYIAKNRNEYRNEIALLQHDIRVLGYDADLIHDTLVLMLTNHVIWENESKARAGGSEQDKFLKFTHSINGVRTRAKNRLSMLNGERVDLKIDCLAEDLPPEFGNWRVYE